MRKKITTLILVLILTVMFVHPAVASGGKVRGEEGQGAVNQHQVVTPPVPFP